MENILHMFVGQGVKSLHGNYGVIQKIAEKRVKLRDGQNGYEVYDHVPDYSRITIRTAIGLKTVSRDMLTFASMPDAETDRLRAKYGMTETKDAAE